MFFSSFNTSVRNDQEIEPESEDEIDYDAELKKILENLNLSELLKFDNEIKLDDYGIDDILGNPDQIMQTLKERVIDESELIEKCERRVDSIDQTISYYKDLFFDDNKRYSRIKANKFLLPDSSNAQDKIIDGVYLTEVQIEEKIKEKQSEPGPKVVGSQNKSFKRAKTIENTYYFNFDENEFNDLPGGLEAIQLLSHVTNAMGFKPSFLKYWLPIIRSEASIGILLDAFWWFYLTYFSENQEEKVQAMKYFSRVADSFSALLMSVHSSIRDRFFDHYAKFLSQAIYFVFYQIYSDSRFVFNDKFKQDICNVVYEWVLGVKPIPETYKQWEINENLENAANQGAQLKVASTVEIMHKISNLEKLLNSLGSKETKPEKTIRYVEDKFALIRNYPKESHVTGQGAVVEKVLFNPKGQSMLISHYLKMHNLKEQLEAPAHKIAISEIKKQADSSAMTYREVVKQTYERSKSAEAELKRISIETENEIKRIEKERLKTIIEKTKIKNADIQTLATIIAKERKESLSEENEKEPTYKEYDDDE